MPIELNASDEVKVEEFAGGLFAACLATMELANVELGIRLGLYEALAGSGPLTSTELARRAGIAERYAREWLEQQATAGILRADVGPDATRFELPAGHAEVLLDGDSLSFMGASVMQLMALRGAFDHVVEAFRTGAGVPYEAYGADGVEGQGGANRPIFLSTLPSDWLPAIPEVHDRLSSDGEARVLDVGCGTGIFADRLDQGLAAGGVAGCDLSAGMLAEAAARSRRVGWVRGDSARLPVRRGAVDAVVCTQAFHFFDQPAAWREFQRVLTPGGHAMVGMMHPRTEAGSRRFSRLLTGASKTGVTFPTKAEMRRMATEAGFDVIGQHDVAWRFRRITPLVVTVGRAPGYL